MVSIPQTLALARPRFNVLLSKKVSLKAVIRNKIKRIFYETIRENLQSLKTSVDILFIPTRQCVNTDKNTLKTEIVRVLKRLG